MHKITFGGKEYVKATEIAKKFRYTQDYVGQLCRSGKVEARLVGRSWFVVADSVTAYRKTKHQTQKKAARTYTADAKTPNRNPKKPTKRVEPVVRAKTVKMTAAPVSNQATHLKTQYEPDANVLIPVLGARTKPVSQPKKKPAVTIATTPSVTVAVTSEKKTGTKFKSEKLPEISLSGKLSVKNNSEESDVIESVVADKPKKVSVVQSDRFSKEKQAPLPTSPVLSESADVILPKSTIITPSGAQKRVDFTPKLMAESYGNKKTFLIVLVVVALTSIFLSVVLLGVGDQIVVSDSESVHYYKFRIENLKEVFNYW